MHPPPEKLRRSWYAWYLSRRFALFRPLVFVLLLVSIVIGEMLGGEERESLSMLVVLVVDRRLWGCKRDLPRRGQSSREALRVLSREALRAVCIFPIDDFDSVGCESVALRKDDGGVDLVIGRAMEVFGGDCNSDALPPDELKYGDGDDPRRFIIAGLL